MWQIPTLPTPRPAVLAPSDEIGLNWAWILHGITGYNPPRHAWMWLDMDGFGQKNNVRLTLQGWIHSVFWSEIVFLSAEDSKGRNSDTTKCIIFLYMYIYIYYICKCNIESSNHLITPTGRISVWHRHRYQRNTNIQVHHGLLRHLLLRRCRSGQWRRCRRCRQIKALQKGRTLKSKRSGCPGVRKYTAKLQGLQGLWVQRKVNIRSIQYGSIAEDLIFSFAVSNKPAEHQNIYPV